MVKKHGGKRKRSGRPRGSKGKKTIEQKLALDFLKKKILKKFENLIDSKIRLAEGVYIGEKVWVPGKGKKKKQLVTAYQKPPDGAAIEYLISMVVGKPREEGFPPTSVTINLISANVEAAKKRVAKKKKQ